MQTTLKEVSPVARELEIRATADELEPELNKVLRAQRSQVDMKGFRKGKVPLSLVKKMYGEALSLQVAEKFVQDAFEEEVDGNDEIDVLGQPQMTDLDYQPDGDLRAVIAFGVRPEVELKDLSGEEVARLKHEVTDEEVEKEIERLRRREADLRPTEEGATEESFVVFDMQELDGESGAPIVGKKDEDQSFFLDSPQVQQNPMLSELRDELLGAKPGDTVRFTFEHDQAHGGHAGGEAHAHHFQADVKEVKARELPEVDDAFIEEATDGAVETVDAFRSEVRRRLQQSWDERSRELLQGQITRRMLELHPVPVPDQVVEMYLDSFVEDVKQRNDGDLPQGFDETHFRGQNRREAEQQAHWMLVRDQVIEENAIEATDDDLQAFFEEQAEGEPQLSAGQLRQFYQSMPDMMGQIEQQVLSRKVYAVLAERFTVTEKDREAFDRDVEQQRAAQQPPAEAGAGASEEPSGADEPSGSGLVTPSGAPARTATAEPDTETEDAEEAEPAASGEEPEYEAWTKDDLYEKAQEIDLSGRSSMTKAELIEALRAEA